MKVAQLDAAANSIDQSIASLNLGVTGMPQFSVYQIMLQPATVTAVR